MSACESLAAQASGGVGPALAAVDCLANEMAAGAFSRLFGTQGGLLPALTLLLTLYIALFAFALITGRSRIGVSVLTPRMVTLGVVLTFATSWMAWQQVVWNLAIGAPDQIAALIMGTQGPATRLFADRIDMVLGAISAAGEAVGSTAASATSGGAFSPQGVMWLAAMLLLLGTVGVLVTARIALAVLLAVGPVFVVMGLFRQTRGLTAGWARALVLSALTPLFVVAGGSLMLELAVPVVAGLDGGMGGGQPGIDARAAMALFLIAAVHCALMTMMMKVAGT
ncbi:MAG TPA: type IV secretion system protein, partial [Novosphingobium sp.]|nr:type IV secretion system protein [Novosphingobium sp.]